MEMISKDPAQRSEATEYLDKYRGTFMKCFKLWPVKIS